MTANLKLGEVLCDAVVAKLRQYMPARCAAINEFYGGNDPTQIIAPRPENYFTGRVSDLANPPAIYVMEGPKSYILEGGHGLITHTQVLVYILESDQTGPLLARRLRRQERAIVEAVWDDDPVEKLIVQSGPFAGQESAYAIFPVRSVPGRVFEPTAEHEWQGIYTVIFEAHQLEH